MPTIEKRGMYYYKKTNGKLVRVSAKVGDGRRRRSQSRKANKRRSLSRKSNTVRGIRKPSIGDRVKITIKPYVDKYAVGIVEQVLTRKLFHPRGHKVRLRNGQVGRVTR